MTPGCSPGWRPWPKVHTLKTVRDLLTERGVLPDFEGPAGISAAQDAIDNFALNLAAEKGNVLRRL
ncbi:MAG: hypothetical protein ABI806_10055 [Candidatus Solibacter sp.]